MATEEELRAVITLVDEYTEQLAPIIAKTKEVKDLVDSVKPKIPKPKDNITPIYKKIIELVKKVKNAKANPKVTLLNGAKTIKELAKIRKETLLLKAKTIGLKIKNISTSNISNVARKLKSIVSRRWEARVGVKDKASSVLGKIKGMLGALAAGVVIKTAIQESDKFAGTKARLNLMNDGKTSAPELQKDIFKESMSSRSDYQTMSDVVSRLGITAGDKFKDNKEIVKFSSLLNKQFKISGASGEEQNAAMYQLSQAMASGALQGDEFRSIKENAPLLAKAIQKELGDKDIKEAASNGEITSDVIKRAMFNSAGEIEERFNQIPWTFKDAMTIGLNGIRKGAEPIFQGLNNLINNNSVKKFITDLPELTKNAFSEIGKIFNNIFNGIDLVGIFNALKDTLSPAIDLFKSLFDNISNNSPKAQKVLQVFGDIVKTVFSMMKPVVEVAGIVIKTVMNFIAEHSKEIQNIIKALGVIWGVAWAGIRKVIEIAGPVIGGILSGIIKVLDGIADAINTAKSAWNSLKKAFSGGATANINVRENGIGQHGGLAYSAHRPRKAYGQSRIPYNNYFARLHEGERVLTKQEANAYERRKNGSGVNINMYGTTIREESDIDLLADRFVKKIRLANQGGI